MILAPMQGLTEVLFRRVYEECFPHAIERAVSPFISLTHGSLAAATEKVDDVMPEANAGSIPVTPQILGKEKEEFVQLANRLHELGYGEVNWNMGCPMRKVAGKHRGSGILPYPGEVDDILGYVVPRIKPALSVKVRLGLKSPDEIFALIPVLNAYPLASVTIHPRLGRQQYSGQPDLDTFGRAAALIKHPVIYNGDIVREADARRVRERFPQVADIMVGRGVLYRPTLPLDLANPQRSHDDDRTLTTRFVKRLMEEVALRMPTPEARIRKTKEYWALVWRSLNISENQARSVLREGNYEAVEKMISSFLQ